MPFLRKFGRSWKGSRDFRSSTAQMTRMETYAVRGVLCGDAADVSVFMEYQYHIQENVKSRWVRYLLVSRW